MAAGHDWKMRLASYLREPGPAWERPDERQVVKLRSVFSRARREYGLDTESLIESVVHAVENRDPAEQRPIYLSNLGGCGSHWISRMMAQAGGLVDVGEVYLPVPWYGSMLELPRDVAARVLDGVELLHGLLYNGTPGAFVDSRVVNSAHGYEKIAFHRALRPLARIVHLTRDPRDRTLSVSFRKQEFRDYEAAGVDDREYFMSKALRSLSAWRKYDSLERKADIEIRYEAFRLAAADELERLLAAVGVPAAKPLVEAIAHRNSPEYLRSAHAHPAERGNLDQGGVAASWRSLPGEMRRTLHSTVAPALLGQNYPLCDCFPGEELPGLTARNGLADALAELEGDCHRLEFKHRGEVDWLPLSAVEAERVVRVRVRVRADGRMPDSVIDAMRPWLTDLCAAGVRTFNNRSIQAMGRLPRLACMDLARTAVTAPLRMDRFPRLALLNLSGTAVAGFSKAGVKTFDDYT